MSPSLCKVQSSSQYGRGIIILCLEGARGGLWQHFVNNRLYYYIHLFQTPIQFGLVIGILHICFGEWKSLRNGRDKKNIMRCRGNQKKTQIHLIQILELPLGHALLELSPCCFQLPKSHHYQVQSSLSSPKLLL